MEYVIPIVILIIAIAGFVTFLVLNATRKGQSNPDDTQAPGIGQDETPLGDTSEHAGTQTEGGTTVAGQDAAEGSGTGRPVHSGYAGTSGVGGDSADPDAAAHVRRPGEGEGAESLHFDGHRPESDAERGSGSRAAGR